ncbi:hypothetical protein O181_048435 [Austropuccinia psidii MF-1]|uniref:Uncharacterized protein n=1 Tax=Austropuccinia psidii MF-1 TaxID=1389203 RepID=A0A9Q3HP73_9BASI|nr:hypothetical protein [Austropuccinia psidii MF-1]
MSQFSVKTQEEFDELHRSDLTLQELTTLQEEKITAIQESCPKLQKSSEETKKRLNKVFEEKYYCKRDMNKKKNSCHNCGSTDHYANSFPQAKKKVYVIEQVPEEGSPTEDSESASIGDAIREHCDDYQDPNGEFLVEHQEETQLSIQDVQLETEIPQDSTNKNWCKNTQDSQTFLVTQSRRMAYIRGTATKKTVCIGNA